MIRFVKYIYFLLVLSLGALYSDIVFAQLADIATEMAVDAPAAVSALPAPVVSAPAPAPITPEATPAPSSVPAAAISGSPATPATVPHRADITNTKEIKAIPLPIGNAVFQKSIFFSDEQLEAIYKARTFYNNHKNGVVEQGVLEDDFLSSLEKAAPKEIIAAEEEEKSFTYPQFYLSSIAYYSANNWVLWINSNKITQDSGQTSDGLKVLSINSNKVVLEWQPKRMDKIADIQDNSGKSAVHIDFLNKKITFELKPNQTFTSYAMQIVEGKLPEKTVTYKQPN